MAGATGIAANAVTGPVSRRGFIGRCASVPVAGVAAGGIAGSATAAVAGAKLTTYSGEYAIDSHHVVDGFFAAPRGRTGLDVVVVIPAAGAPAATAVAAARSYAAQGWMAIAPDLASTYKGAALLGRSAMVAALMRDVPRLRRFARGNGTVTVVTA